MNESEGQSFDERLYESTLTGGAAARGAVCEGMQIGNFQLRAKLGRGGMGEVWQAWDTKAERLVVMKLVLPELQHAGEEMARVKVTFQRVQALQHQHICPLYVLDEDPRFGWYLVMKYIDGQTLSAYRSTYAARHGTFPLEQVVKVLRPVAEALDYAHRHRVIHRDIKPQNLLVVGDANDVQVVDFGLAAEIRTTVSRFSQQPMDTCGTRRYMAPEQWRGRGQDARTDQYGLAVVAYELLSGDLPFDSSDFEILRACVVNDPPEAIAGQSPAVNRALVLGLAKRREERFSTCCEFVEALAGSTAVEAPPPVVKQVAVKSTAAPAAKPLSVISNSIGMKLVLIPAGEFLMGSADGGSDVSRQHQVRITKPFYLGATPVTQQEYVRVMGKNPSRFKGSGGFLGFFAHGVDRQRPVERVSWENAVTFCRKLSEQDGHTYRLPTEAEWEYACRAGSTTTWCFGDNESVLKEYAWYDENSGGTTHAVAQKEPNAWGLYDMHGNVCEWCADWYGDYPATAVEDPTGPAGGSDRVIRGGGGGYDAFLCRAFFRYGIDPDDRSDYLGFRLARAVS